IALDELGHRGVRCGLMVDEVAQAPAFEEGDAEAIGVFTRTRRETREAENDVRRLFAGHAQQLAHGSAPARVSKKGHQCRPVRPAARGFPRHASRSPSWTRPTLPPPSASSSRSATSSWRSTTKTICTPPKIR